MHIYTCYMHIYMIFSAPQALDRELSKYLPILQKSPYPAESPLWSRGNQ